MQILLGGTNNVYTTVFSVAAKTLTISGVNGFDLTDSSLSSVYDTVAAVNIPCQRVTCALSRVGGKPVWTFTFFSLPAGVADGHALVIYLNAPNAGALYSVEEYIASKAA